jgi:CRISPR-associated protein Csb1
MEQALLEAHRKTQVQFPLIEVDFMGQRGLEDLGKITTLDAPHRIADAILRDSLYDGIPFRLSEPGQRFTNVSLKNATALFALCPTALIFGVWDSTGPRGGFGAKFERALVSEIIGVDPTQGRRTGGRLDPLQIRRNLGEGYTIYRHRDPDQLWTIEENEAEVDDKGQPRKVGRRGQPSEINHGNVTPDLARAPAEARASGGEVIRQGAVLDGGVTIRYALQTTVLSLPVLRRLRFPVGEPDIPERHVAARSALAALALAAVVLQRQQGYSLRSRCLLVPDAPLVFEIVPAEGGEPTHYQLNVEQAAQLVKEATERAGGYGLAWESQPMTLIPAPKLVKLVQRTRELEPADVEPEDSGGS